MSKKKDVLVLCKDNKASTNLHDRISGHPTQ